MVQLVGPAAPSRSWRGRRSRGPRRAGAPTAGASSSGPASRRGGAAGAPRAWWASTSPQSMTGPSSTTRETRLDSGERSSNCRTMAPPIDHPTSSTSRAPCVDGVLDGRLDVAPLRQARGRSGRRARRARPRRCGRSGPGRSSPGRAAAAWPGSSPRGGRRARARARPSAGPPAPHPRGARPTPASDPAPRHTSRARWRHRCWRRADRRGSRGSTAPRPGARWPRSTPSSSRSTVPAAVSTSHDVAEADVPEAVVDPQAVAAGDDRLGGRREDHRVGAGGAHDDVVGPVPVGREDAPGEVGGRGERPGTGRDGASSPRPRPGRRRAAPPGRGRLRATGGSRHGRRPPPQHLGQVVGHRLVELVVGAVARAPCRAASARTGRCAGSGRPPCGRSAPRRPARGAAA